MFLQTNALLQARIDRRWRAITDGLGRVYGTVAAEALAPRLQHWIASSVAQRSDELQLLDMRREADPEWFQHPSMIGYVTYVDRFAGTLAGVNEQVEYLEQLGIRYLHLMPLLQPRAGESDGGYAVQDYNAVDARLGTMDDLEALAATLRASRISLCVDLVVNHTAKEHDWARRAVSGEQEYRDRYFFFPDRALPDEYERTLREVFPAFKPGNFTWVEAAQSWVWTTFNEFQWDLNYGNPDVLVAMLEIMAGLANRGVEVLRLDAVPFMWKRLGTDCENQPEVHDLLEVIRALMSIVAPALVLKAEAIVPRDLLVPYLGAGDPQRYECDLAYHNQLMVMLWSSLATGDAVLMRHALQQMAAIPPHTCWITYVRCHDDIGWAVTDEDAGAVGWNGFAHRRFLNDFYSGRFATSFARGALFQENQATGDARVSGTAASLCGLELALEADDPAAVAVACARLQLLYAVAYCFGGIPVVYMGDELGLLNDYSFVDVPAHAEDNRWLHRPQMDWEQAQRRLQPGTIEHELSKFFQELAIARSSLGQLHGGARTIMHDVGHPALLCFERKHHMRDPFWMVANFGTSTVTLPSDYLPRWRGLKQRVVHQSDDVAFGDQLVLPPLGWAWLVSA